MTEYVKVKTGIVWAVVTAVITAGASVWGTAAAVGSDKQHTADELLSINKTLADHEERLRMMQSTMARTDSKIDVAVANLDHLTNMTTTIVRGLHLNGGGDLDPTEVVMAN